LPCGAARRHRRRRCAVVDHLGALWQSISVAAWVPGRSQHDGCAGLRDHVRPSVGLLPSITGRRNIGTRRACSLLGSMASAKFRFSTAR
jgi:hypothetical protein